MTHWRDGVGRITVKADTGGAVRGDAIVKNGQFIGVCRAPGWLQVYGPASIPTGLSESELSDAVAHRRGVMAARAKRLRLPGYLRHDIARDPRYWDDEDRDDL